MTSRPPRIASVINTAVLCTLLIESPVHGSIDFFRIGKRIFYLQDSDSEPTTIVAIDGGVDLSASDPNDLASARVFSTNPILLSPSSPFVLTEFFPGYWGSSSVYPSLESLDEHLPPGDRFGYLIEGGNLGARMAVIQIPLMNLFAPQTPHFTGNTFSQLNGLNVTSPFTFTWNGYTPLTGINDAPIFFTIYRISDGQSVAGTVVANTVTSYDLSPNTLAPNTQYRAELYYSSRVNTPNKGFVDADSSVSYDLATNIYFTTASAAQIVVPEHTAGMLVLAMFSLLALHRRRMTPARLRIALIIVVSHAASPVVADIQFYRFGKTQLYTQTSNAQPTTPASIYGGMDMFTNIPDDLASAWVYSTRTSPPGPTPEYLLTQSSPGHWGYTQVFASLAAMDMEFVPSDTYGYLIDGGFLGPQLALLDSPATNLFAPSVPYFTNNAYTALNNLITSQPYTLKWQGFTPPVGIDDAPIFVNIARVSDGQTAISTVVASNVSSLLVPANTLAPNTQYRATLFFSCRIVSLNSGFVNVSSVATGDAAVGFDLGTDLLFTTAPLEDADFDADNDIDGRDFLIWQRNFGVTGQTNNSNGDANFNGTVGAEDLAVWKNQYGTSGPFLGVATAVPEPGLSTSIFINSFLVVFSIRRPFTHWKYV